MTLKSKIESGKFAILAEMEPPKGVDITPMTESAIKVKEKVDAFVVSEMNNAVMRMSALGGAMILGRRGIETVMQVNCRDRNRIALQADLLAAFGCGITNVMAVTGSDPAHGDHSQARPVHDIDLLELLKAIQALQQGKDMAGIQLNGSPTFLVGSISMAGAKGRSFEMEVEDMKKKVDAGTRFFITPPLFNVNAILPILEKTAALNISIIPSVMLLKSLGMARYMVKNMTHIDIPDDLIHRIQKAPDKVRECQSLATETIRALKSEGFSGVMISTLGWEHKLSQILEKI